MDVARIMVDWHKRSMGGRRGAHVGLGGAELHVALGVSKQRILMRDLVSVLEKDLVFGAKPAASHAWQREQRFEGVSTVAIVFAHLLDGVVYFFRVWLALRMVVMASPHDVVCGGPRALAGGVRADIGVDHFGVDQPVWGTNAASYNGLQQTSLAAVLAKVVGGVLGREIVHGGLAVNLRRNADHVFSVPFWLGAVGWQILVDSFREMA